MLIERGQTVTSLSEEMCYPRTTISKAIHSDRFPRLRKRIARKLGITEGL
jgi:lambda repressor-like predicted transcriptional regulator